MSVGILRSPLLGKLVLNNLLITCIYLSIRFPCCQSVSREWKVVLSNNIDPSPVLTLTTESLKAVPASLTVMTYCTFQELNFYSFKIEIPYNKGDYLSDLPRALGTRCIYGSKQIYADLGHGRHNGGQACINWPHINFVFFLASVLHFMQF